MRTSLLCFGLSLSLATTSKVWADQNSILAKCPAGKGRNALAAEFAKQLNIIFDSSQSKKLAEELGLIASPSANALYKIPVPI